MSDAAVHGHAAHGEHRFLAHHFANMDRQVDASRLGMWLFLSTEILLFVGLFTAYSVYRFSFPNAWAQASRHSEIWAGTTNTFVLITSSLTVALAIHFVRVNARSLAVIMLGIWFLQQAVFGAANLTNPTGSGGGVAYFAHVGGFVFGLLVIKLFATRRKEIPPRVPVY